jgi:CheY-like chemotaxis protein
MSDSSPVLLVEDDPDIVDVVEMILQRDGWAVAVACDGQQALDRLQAGTAPRLILLDFRMPGLDGWQFCERLRADPALAGIPVVVLSGASDLAQDAESVGAVAYLRKPFEIHQLLATVRRHARPIGLRP